MYFKKFKKSRNKFFCFYSFVCSEVHLSTMFIMKLCKGDEDEPDMDLISALKIYVLVVPLVIILVGLVALYLIDNI